MLPPLLAATPPSPAPPLPHTPPLPHPPCPPRPARHYQDVSACRGELEAQLAAMESKVLQGEAQGGLSALAARQEEVLRSQQQQLKQQRSADAAKLRQIADMEEAALMAQGKYSSLQALLCAHTASCTANRTANCTAKLHCACHVWPETPS